MFKMKPVKSKKIVQMINEVNNVDLQTQSEYLPEPVRLPEFRMTPIESPTRDKISEASDSPYRT